MFLDYALPFLFIFTILVFVHELGHYWVAKRFGVQIETFSIGFGPELFGWTDKSKTRWKISVIPFGGYVKYLGDLDASSRPNNEALNDLSPDQKSKTLHGKSVSERILIAFAGPLANYLMAMVVFFGLFMTVGQRYVPAEVSGFAEVSAAKEAGLQEKDLIKSINGENIQSFSDLERFVKSNAGVPLNMIIERNKEEMSVTVTPKETEVTTNGEVKKIGQLGIIRSMEGKYIQHNFITALYHSVTEPFVFSWNLMQTLGQMLVGKRSSDELGGIIQIAYMSGQAAQMGISTLLWFMAILSVNLGFFNLLPIPMLDGGHILFYAIEGIRKKPISEKIQERAFMVGLSVVLALMVYTNGNDLVKFKVFSWIKNLFS